MRTSKWLAVVGAACVTLLATSASAQDLQITAGTMQLGGNLNFQIDAVMPDTGDTKTGYQILASPAFGYFVIDGLEVYGWVTAGMSFGDLYEGSSTDVGFGVGAQYVIDLGMVIYPYAGLGIGMGFTIPDQGDTTKALDIAVPLGILIEMNPHVAIDLGLMVNVNMSLEDGGPTILNVPIGYFGVQAFI